MSSLAKEIELFISSANKPVAFCGAGVAAHAGLPVWHALIQKLAQSIKEIDPATFQQMNDCADLGLLEKAADYFFMSHKIQSSARYQVLSALLSKYNADSLMHLVKIPFSAYITTNYDKAIHDAFANAHSQACIEVHFGDPSLAEAPFYNDPYIARIHGRAEVPRQALLRSEDLNQAEQNENYRTFLLHHFTRSQLMFIGYSFADPAIRNVLRFMAANAVSLHEGRHIALLPNNIDGDLLKLFERVSIRAIRYSSNNGHDELWESFEKVAQMTNRGGQPAPTEKAGHLAYSVAKRFLATCYARTKLTARMEPLYSSVIEGVVAGTLEEAFPMGLTFSSTAERVGASFPIPKADIHRICADCLERLSRGNYIDHRGERYFAKSNGDGVDNPYANAVDRLLSGITNRAKVREDIELTLMEKDFIRSLIEQIVLKRGWDLGAAFASRRIPEELNVNEVSEALMRLDAFSSIRSRRILRSVESLLRSPEPEEQELLVAIGRVSFALELVAQAPRSNFLFQSALPERIYLDANVLMPAIVSHHPFHSLYDELLGKLLSASEGAGSKLKICVFSGFLNEVVAHRRKARSIYNSEGHLDAASFDRRRVFLGLENMNVFLGAYHSLSRGNCEIEFETFLADVAPYESESELRKYLERKGYIVVGDSALYCSGSVYPKLYEWLELEYASLLERERKTGPVLEHDAKQLAILSLDIQAGTRSLLVTADRSLRRLVGNNRFSDLANLMISHVGLAQFVDLVIGRVSHSRSMAKLIWGTRSSSFAEDVRDHLINQALNQHDAAYIMPMHDLVDEIAEDLVFEIERRGLSMDSEKLSVKQEIDSIFSQFEEKFFDGMRREIERRAERE